MVNIDDQRVVDEAGTSEIEKKVTFGCDENADIKVVDNEPFDLSTSTQEVTLSVKGKDIISVAIPLPGKHHAINASCALATVFSLGYSIKDAALGLKDSEYLKGVLLCLID